MNRLSFVLSLITSDNDYQREQAAAAREAAERLGVDLQTIYAENDAINQSQQLLRAIQSPAGTRPNGIVFEPVGTGLAQVARAAVTAGVGWVVLNREVDYIASLRQASLAPIFALSSDHQEIGRIQGRQLGSLLPRGGLVLYIEGPASSTAAQQRTAGMLETKPSNVQVRTLKGQWNEESACKAVGSWLRLSTSHDLQISAVVAQNDAMAIGAHKAFQTETGGVERQRWMALPFTGCDGLPQTGAEWVRRGLLAATVVVPPNTGPALEMLVQAIQTSSQPAAHGFIAPKSYPAIEELTKWTPRATGRV